MVATGVRQSRASKGCTARSGFAKPLSPRRRRFRCWRRSFNPRGRRRQRTIRWSGSTKPSSFARHDLAGDFRVFDGGNNMVFRPFGLRAQVFSVTGLTISEDRCLTTLKSTGKKPASSPRRFDLPLSSTHKTPLVLGTHLEGDDASKRRHARIGGGPCLHREGQTELPDFAMPALNFGQACIHGFEALRAEMRQELLPHRLTGNKWRRWPFPALGAE